MKADWRAQSARPREMSLANLLREAKGGRVPPFIEKLRSADEAIWFSRIASLRSQ